MTHPRPGTRRPTRRPARPDSLGEVLVSLVLAVLAIVGLAWASSCLRTDARRDCEARGGSFISTQHSNGHYSWSCWTPPPGYRRQGGDR